MLIVFPLAHVPNYRGPWVLRGIPSTLEVQNQLEAGFKHPGVHGCRHFHDLKGPVHGVQDPKEDWIQAVLLKFLEYWETFPLCCAVWCGGLYHHHPEDPFLVQTSLSKKYDKSEDLDTEERINKRFQISRDRYHLMVIPFECYLCKFSNLNESYPIHSNIKYNYTMLCIRRDIMDAFWSQETSTVLGNFRRLRRDYFESMGVFSIGRLVPIIGTHEVRYWVGMVCALQTLGALRRKVKWQY